MSNAFDMILAQAKRPAAVVRIEERMDRPEPLMQHLCPELQAHLASGYMRHHAGWDFYQMTLSPMTLAWWMRKG